MTTIEKIRNYIDKTKTFSDRYDMYTDDVKAIYLGSSNIVEAMYLTFEFGRAKGLREARAEAKKA